MTALSISRRQALAFRLDRQQIFDHQGSTLLDTAAMLLGAQAQVHSAGIQQLRVRCGAVDQAAVSHALQADRSLVKIWAQRSTLHFVPRADLPLLLALRRHAIPTYRAWFTREGLDDGQIDRLVQAIQEALADGPASRSDLSTRLVPILGDWSRPWLEHSWGGVLKMMAALGLACHGPPRDRESTFVRLVDWVGVLPADEDPLLAEVLRRYLASYGPATLRDFGKFTGLPMPAVRAAFAAIEGELLPVEIDGQPAYALTVDEPALRAAEMPPGHLAILPLFDPWLLAHADTAGRLTPKRRAQVYRVAGWISPVILREGEIIGVWSHERVAAGWSVSIAPFKALGPRQLGRIEKQLRRLAGVPVMLSVEEPG
ncbi:MAG TPA: winged helix DNA-binding domain-containing protein [Stellaceae bacterium]|nr:winged helix DNA-binding domain-containing protein [Stellaceae bacterium]